MDPLNIAFAVLSGLVIVKYVIDSVGKSDPSPTPIDRHQEKRRAIERGDVERLNCRFPCAEGTEGSYALVTEEEDGSLTITVVETTSEAQMAKGEPSQYFACVRLGPYASQWILTNALADGWNGEEPPQEHVEPIGDPDDEMETAHVN